MSKKGLKDILQLGHPLLYEMCNPVLESELPLVKNWVKDLANAMSEIREKYNFGRGIAAPQLGVLKRLIYIDLGTPKVLINPELTNLSDDTFELWDDCMSFPNLLVRVKRHKSLTIKYLDENFTHHSWTVSGDVSELIQHEYDHLNGILCTMRAIDDKSFKWRP
jgi:peptide deformylase